MAAPSNNPLSVYYHTHWDREWYLPFRSYQVRLAEVVDEVLERLETNALPCFMLDGQTVVLEDYLELRPENEGRLRALIADGRLSIGPWYVAPDEFLISGESIIRNLQRGLAMSRAWGCDQFTGYLPDTFGHSADMPAILNGFGLTSAIAWRGLNPKKSLLNWASPGGESVRLLHLTEGYFQMQLDDWEATPEQRLTALLGTVEKLRAASLPGAPILLPQGADHMGPTPAEGRTALREAFPDLNETTPEKFMANLNGLSGLETLTGELTDNSAAFLLPGVYSARMYLKQANRKLEHRLTHQVEPLLAMAQTLLPQGQRPRYAKQELDLAWKTLILNHPHDSICGCSVDEVHRENEVRFDQVQELTDAITDRAEHALSALGAGNEWVVVNTGDRPYTGLVPVVEDLDATDATGAWMQVETEGWVLEDSFQNNVHRIPMAHAKRWRREGLIHVAGVPAHGVQVLPKHHQPAVSPVIAEERTLENETLRVTVQADGSLTILEKRTGKAHAGLGMLSMRSDEGDSYNSDPIPGETLLRARLLSCRADGEANLLGRLRMELAFDGAEFAGLQFAMLLTLRVDAPWLEIEILFGEDFPPAHKIQLLFPTAGPIETVQAESHFSLVNRCYDPAYDLAAQTPAGKMKEHVSGSGPIQRFMSVNGQSLMTEGLAEYDVLGPTLGITLLRTFSMLSAENLRTRGAPAGPPLETLEGTYQQRGLQAARLAWLPTPDEASDLYEQAGRFYGTVWGFSGKRETGASAPAPQSLVRWDNLDVIASACHWLPGKTGEPDGLLLRLVNLSDQDQVVTLETGFKSQSLHLADLTNRPTAELPAPTLTLPARRFQSLCWIGVE